MGTAIAPGRWQPSISSCSWECWGGPKRRACCGRRICPRSGTFGASGWGGSRRSSTSSDPAGGVFEVAPGAGPGGTFEKSGPAILACYNNGALDVASLAAEARAHAKLSPSGPVTGEAQMGNKVMDVKDGNFEDEVLHSTIPVILDFTAEWCGPCQKMQPILEEIATEFEGRAKVGSVDVGSAQETAVRLGVMSVPTVIFFKNGRVQETVIGLTQKSSLVSRLQRLL